MDICFERVTKKRLVQSLVSGSWTHEGRGQHNQLIYKIFIFVLELSLSKKVESYINHSSKSTELLLTEIQSELDPNIQTQARKYHEILNIFRTTLPKIFIFKSIDFCFRNIANKSKSTNSISRQCSQCK